MLTPEEDHFYPDLVFYNRLLNKSIFSDYSDKLL